MFMDLNEPYKLSSERKEDKHASWELKYEFWVNY